LIATPSFAASPDFSHLDDAAARAASCDRKANAAYETGDNKAILMALNEQGKCLEVVMFSVAREFYDDNAFGAGGVEARIHEMRENLAQLYSTIYSEAPFTSNRTPPDADRARAFGPDRCHFSLPPGLCGRVVVSA
jgi:hypothetical protein